MPSDPRALLRSRSYLGLLALAAIIGVPVSAAAYGFLALLTSTQRWFFGLAHAVAAAVAAADPGSAAGTKAGVHPWFTLTVRCAHPGVR